MTSEAPIPLSRDMVKSVQDWAADDRLWSTKETTEFNLYTFARLILKLAASQPSTEVSSTPAASSSPEGSIPSLREASGSGDLIFDKLRWVRRFIEYARYELQPGQAALGSQFPHQADADRAMAQIDEVLITLYAGGLPPQEPT